jgi:hypothetical protein
MKNAKETLKFIGSLLVLAGLSAFFWGSSAPRQGGAMDFGGIGFFFLYGLPLVILGSILLIDWSKFHWWRN